MKSLFQYGLYLAVFLSALQIVITRHEARSLFVELQDLESVRDELNETWGRLQLEQSAWSLNDRVESLARNEFDMKIPDQHFIIMLSE